MARSVLCLMWFLNHLQSGCYHCLCISVSISMQGPLFHERYMDYTDRTVCDLVKSTAKCICRHCMQEPIMDMSRGNTIRKKKCQSIANPFTCFTLLPLNLSRFSIRLRSLLFIRDYSSCGSIQKASTMQNIYIEKIEIDWIFSSCILLCFIGANFIRHIE